MGSNLCKTACQEVEKVSSERFKMMMDQGFKELKKDLLDCIRQELSKTQNSSNSNSRLVELAVLPSDSEAGTVE